MSNEAEISIAFLASLAATFVFVIEIVALDREPAA
jgi:hypothetical protein